MASLQESAVVLLRSFAALALAVGLRKIWVGLICPVQKEHFSTIMLQHHSDLVSLFPPHPTGEREPPQKKKEKEKVIISSTRDFGIERRKQTEFRKKKGP